MLNKLKRKISYWSQAFLIPVYWLSHLFPRNRQIWVMGSTFGKRWADNARYFYLYVSQFERDKIHTVWITREKWIAGYLTENGYTSYYVRSLKGIYYCLRAGVYVFDNYSKDICYWLSGGAMKVNLWHGSGNKKTNYDNKFDYLRHPRNFREWFCTGLIRMTNERPGDYTLATSSMMEDIFVSAFHTDHSHIILEGYPRNDMLFESGIQNLYTKEEQDLLTHIKEWKKKGSRLLIYMPTFRESEIKFFEVMDLDEFHTFLEQENLVFFTKMHPKSKVKEAFAKLSYQRIVNIDAQVDPYTFLRCMDLLVTDYSSIYSDFLLLDRPSVLFVFDFEEYSRDTRECYFTYEEYMPERKAKTMQELIQGIREAFCKDSCADGRRALRDRIFKTQDGLSSKRLCRKIQDILNRQKRF